MHLWATFFWIVFAMSPLGGLYYLMKSHKLNIEKMRNKTLQSGLHANFLFVGLRASMGV